MHAHLAFPEAITATQAMIYPRRRACASAMDSARATGHRSRRSHADCRRQTQVPGASTMERLRDAGVGDASIRGDGVATHDRQTDFARRARSFRATRSTRSCRTLARSAASACLGVRSSRRITASLARRVPASGFCLWRVAASELQRQRNQDQRRGADC
jgi:hypothetical protein